MAPANSIASACEAAIMANAEAVKAAKVFRTKAEEAKEAARTAMARAEGAAKAMAQEATEEELFAASFRRYWNRLYACSGVRTFNQTTSIPAMCYTDHDLDDDVSTKAMDTLVIVSVRVLSIKEYCLAWPLRLNNCQTITEEDPYLALTGPSRAIAVSGDPSYIEVTLKVKGATESEDKDLCNLVLRYNTECCLKSIYHSRLSTLEFKFSHMARSVEATISIQVNNGSWPEGFGGIFTCRITKDDDHRVRGFTFSKKTREDDDIRVKLLDFGDDGLPVDTDGLIKLSRSVVSIGFGKALKVSAMACPINNDGDVESGEVDLGPQHSGSSHIQLNVGSCSMKVIVHWSLFHED
ncbi:unnamed protein product [Alopecurus aequalis]